MNHIHWSLFLQLVSISSMAQDDVQATIHSGKNIFTVSRQEGFDMILFESRVWDSMVDGTRYVSSELKTRVALPVYIQVSCRASGCRSGIGFTCSIFDRQLCDGLIPTMVDHGNRFSSALIRKQPGGSIELILLDTIDWASLQSGSEVSTANE